MRCCCILTSLLKYLYVICIGGGKCQFERNNLMLNINTKELSICDPMIDPFAVVNNYEQNEILVTAIISKCTSVFITCNTKKVWICLHI